MTDDEKISQRYRALGAEEPPRALDDAILAAARRGRRPQRWYAPLATAAVLVLAVAVTLHMRIEQPELEAPVPRAQKEAPAAAQPQAPAVAESALKAVPQRAKPRAELLAKPPEPPGFVPAPPPAAGASGTMAGASGERDARADQPRERFSHAPAAAESVARRPEAQALSLAETPERELERIAGLRAQGRQEEADRALAEFRKRYPDYKIPEEVRVRVERR